MFKSLSSSSGTRHPGFFPTVIEHYPPILDGKFDYNSAFAAFLAATEQKKQTASMVGLLADKLQKRNVLLKNSESIKVADLGCADGTTCLGYLHNMAHPAGFEYIGFDINDRFIQEANAAISNCALIKKYELIKEDVLAGILSAHPSVHPHSMDLIFISHLAYYLKDEAYCKLFLTDILSLLNNSGIAIFLHEDSTYYFRKTYNTSYTNSSAPSLLKNTAADVLKIAGQFNEISFSSKLHFAEMSDELWQAASTPVRYKEYVDNQDFIDNLNKMSFIVQCDLSRLAHEGSLSSFLHDLRGILEANNNSFNLETSMQVLVSPENIYAKEIDAALREMERDTLIAHAATASPCSSSDQAGVTSVPVL
ncbi:methyltransferase domain-containing protein [Legionella geestiana]|uniref:methyltransferase domain-containing protein n=1 Tax=Legionella geestiana TaxID=45065 RepID=UPI00048DC3BB|nr:class I SAM-dependent methyltransferase [Legionella geestiana]STX59194.1 Uncharacterised protein [Legionella geestiana]